MKKITLLVVVLTSISGISQSKSTAVISLNAEMTAQFTLDSANSKVTLVLTGPAATWTSLGLGTCSSTASGDVFVYTTSLINNTTSSARTNQDWSTLSNTMHAGVRTVTLERTLTNSDLNDLQLVFDTTNSIDVVWSRSGSATATSPNANRGLLNAAFTSSLGINELSLKDFVLLYPNPTAGELHIKTKKNISKVAIYSQAGALVKTMTVQDHSNELILNVNDLPKALYLIELQNNTEKYWKKIMVD